MAGTIRFKRRARPVGDIRYEIILYWSEDDQAFIAEVPELPGCAADGATYQAAIANAWVADSEVCAGEEVPVTVFLRPYRGETIQRTVPLRIPPNFPKGQHRILVSDAESLNRMQSLAGFVNRTSLGLNQTVSLINQERSNNRLFVTLVENQPTAYVEDKELPSLPASVQNVLQTGRSATANLVRSPETARELAAIPFDFVVTGSQSLRITVK